MRAAERRNPFHILDVTEVNLSVFVHSFSPVILRNAEALFSQGNVVIKGMQGSGKSMLLGLLRPDVRTAYAEASAPFPVAGELSRFVSASINLTHAGLGDFGHRMSATKGAHDVEIPLLFADFLNYSLALDLFQSLDMLGARADGVVARELGLQMEEERWDRFSRSVASNDCWFGYLSEVSDFAGLRARLRQRVVHYRSFLNYNVSTLGEDVTTTKTAVGQPLSCIVDEAKRHGILPNDVIVLFCIDQFEELIHQKGLVEELRTSFRAVINRALGARNSAFYYRVGTRGHAWEADLTLFGSSRQLEPDRDYKVIDLDDILRRRENRKTWIFPELAQDIFCRRLRLAGYERLAEAKDPLHVVFGGGITPVDLARRYAGKSPGRAVKLDLEWPEEFRTFLLRLAEENPLEARLAEAWARQRNKSSVMEQETFRARPWLEKKWWMKERIPQALMQIAGRCGQQPICSGKDDILGLSGGNALVFLGICRQIWDAWLRAGANEEGPIDNMTQALGILNASEWWLDQMIPGGFDGDARRRFVLKIGTELSARLYGDAAMSNPGHNGFSLERFELDQFRAVGQALRFLSDAGDLFELSHTTKLKDRAPRIKWYLVPIVSPAVRLPYQHTKEPVYLKVGAVASWLRNSGILMGNRLHGEESRSEDEPEQMNLFDNARITR